MGAGSTAAAGGYGYGMATGPPTGTFPVVPRHELRQSKRAVARARRKLRAPTPLKIVTGVALLLVLAVVAGYVILQQRPQWLVSARILRVVEPGGPQAPAPATTSTVPHQVAIVVPGVSGPASSAYSVGTKDFTVDVSTTGPCWVQVTSSESSVPLIVGVQQAGKRLSYPAQGTMTVQVGSSAVVVGISVKGKVVFFTAPHVTPYTYVFAARRPDRRLTAFSRRRRPDRSGRPGRRPTRHPAGRHSGRPCAPPSAPTARTPGSGPGR